ncbi:MAG: aminopeptidase P family protein [Shimia sp.]
MFQTFDAETAPEQGPPRLAALRAELARIGVDGILVPRADMHQGEYVAPRDARLAWLTGFTGSAGFCAVLPGIAGVFVDGRYRVQVRAQVAEDFTPVAWPETALGAWLREHAAEGAVIGFDPWLHTAREVAALAAALDGSGVALRAVDNPIDAIWEDQPPPPAAPARSLGVELTGRGSVAKREGIAEALRAAGQSCVVLTLPDSVSWLLNVRGGDIPRNPVMQAMAVLHADARVDLFVDPAKVAHLGPDPAIALHAPEDFGAMLGGLAGPVRVDHATAPEAVRVILDQAGIEIVDAPDPCLLPKARKTPEELAGHRAAQARDAAAMVEFLAWLDAEAPGALTEIAVVEALEGFRRATNRLEDISFETIAGSGPHGAIVHYRVTRDTDRPLAAGELLLVDSGGQYLDGTTDVTRTIAIGGAPSREEISCYTRVLRGMVAVSRLRFPEGVAGAHLDSVARVPLWEAGQDYDHGTGHGVGAFLSVHEGPQRLARSGTVPLEPGMILSNEPGYYREGAFGIRIENLIAVEAAPPLPGGDDREMLRFETLTWVPFDRRLIDPDALTGAERAWIDAYHAETAARLEGRLSDRAATWLTLATAPL